MNYVDEVKEIREQAIQDFNDNYRKILDIFDANAQSDAVKKFLKAVRECFENDIREKLKYELIDEIMYMQLVNVKVGDTFTNAYNYRNWAGKEDSDKFLEYSFFYKKGRHSIDLHIVDNIVKAINYDYCSERY